LTYDSDTDQKRNKLKSITQMASTLKSQVGQPKKNNSSMFQFGGSKPVDTK